jgi:hypothetical protein
MTAHEAFAGTSVMVFLTLPTVEIISAVWGSAVKARELSKRSYTRESITSTGERRNAEQY